LSQEYVYNIPSAIVYIFYRTNYYCGGAWVLIIQDQVNRPRQSTIQTDYRRWQIDFVPRAAAAAAAAADDDDRHWQAGCWHFHY